MAFRSELSTPFGLVLAHHPTGRGLRLHADELEAEITDPVEESVKLRLVFDFTGEHGVDGAAVQGHAFECRRQSLGQRP